MMHPLLRSRAVHVLLTALLVTPVLVPSTRAYLLPSVGPFGGWGLDLAFDFAVLCVSAALAGFVAARWESWHSTERVGP